MTHAESMMPNSADPIAATTKSAAHAVWFAYLAIMFAGLPFMLDFSLDRPTLAQRLFFQIAALAGAAAYGAARIAGRIGGLPFDPLRLWIAAWLAWLALASALSAAPGRAFVEYGFSLSCAAFYMLSYAYPWSRERASALVSILGASAYASAAYGVAQAFGCEILPYAGQQAFGHMRVLSVFGHPNFAASYLGPALILIASQRLWAGPERRAGWRAALGAGALGAAAFGAAAAFWRSEGLAAMAAAAALGAAAWGAGVFRWLAAAAVALCLVLAGSRSVWISISLAGAVAVALAWRRAPARPRWPRKAIWAIAAAAFGLAAAALASPLRGYIWQRVTETQAVAARLYIYAIGSRMVAERPWLGHGCGGYESGYYDAVIRYQQSRPEAQAFERLLIDTRGDPPGRAHNDLLETAVECGLPGAFAWLALASAFWMRLLSAIRGAAESRDLALLLALGAALGAVAVDSLFAFPLRLPCSGMLFWGLLALASRLCAGAAALPQALAPVNSSCISQ